MSTASTQSDPKFTHCPPWCCGNHAAGFYDLQSHDETVQYGYHQAASVDERICISCEDSLELTSDGFEFTRTPASVMVDCSREFELTAGNVRDLAQSLLAAADILDAINGVTT